MKRIIETAVGSVIGSLVFLMIINLPPPQKGWNDLLYDLLTTISGLRALLTLVLPIALVVIYYKRVPFSFAEQGMTYTKIMGMGIALPFVMLLTIGMITGNTQLLDELKTPNFSNLYMLSIICLTVFAALVRTMRPAFARGPFSS